MQLLVGHLATCHSGDSCELDAVFLLLVAGTVLAAVFLVRLAVVEHRSKAEV